jgi:hypothetical protein
MAESIVRLKNSELLSLVASKKKVVGEKPVKQ